MILLSAISFKQDRSFNAHCLLYLSRSDRSYRYGRVDAELEFGSACESLTGTLDVWVYEPTEDPLDRTTGGTPYPETLSFTGRRVNP